jgi:hypothetical protein
MSLHGRKFSGVCRSLIQPLICDIRHTVRTWKEVTLADPIFHALLYFPPSLFWPTPTSPKRASVANIFTCLSLPTYLRTEYLDDFQEDIRRRNITARTRCGGDRYVGLFPLPPRTVALMIDRYNRMKCSVT